MSNVPDKMVPADEMDPKTLRRYAVKIDHLVRRYERLGDRKSLIKAETLREVRLSMRATARELENS